MMAIFRSDDLVDDRSFDEGTLKANLHADEFGHAAVAAQVGELALRSRGHVNIAIFGPWGAGKSSLFALMRQSLSAQIASKDVELVVFDAWQNAGSEFSVNFLSAVTKTDGARVQRSMATKLFRTRKTLDLPFGLSDRPLWARAIVFVVAVVLFTIVLPGLWTLNELGWPWPWPDAIGTNYVANLKGWLGYGLGGTALLVIAALGTELTRVAVEESAPSHTAQFREIFDQLIKSKKSKKLVVFVDELDRCTPKQLMQTLEGLRTFLGHEQVVFVAAFDREAVAATIASQRESSSVDGRSDAAYYRTAGEYLDKIFQFQLSLPPQSAHTMRRFSLALVKKRSGLWGDLRLAGTLDRVISLLAPAHVRSPRRAKVLLNDFAVNARGLEILLGDGWVDRAPELAVWTVLQTEFPQLAADMAREPDLPRYIADRSIEPQRLSFRELVRRYRDSATALDATTSAPDEKKQVVERQHDDLLLYLQRVQSMRVPLPQPDMVWRTKSVAFETFQDQGLYTALVRAPDQTTSTTLEALESASDADLSQALAFLSRLAEQESPDEAQIIARAMGALAASHEALASAASEMLSSTWRRVAEIDASWNSTESAKGFGRAIARAAEPDLIQVYLQQVQADLPTPSEVVVSTLLAIQDDDWESVMSSILGAAVKELARSGEPLSIALKREETQPFDWPDEALLDDVANALSVAPPTLLPATTSAAIEANRLEQARHDDEKEEVVLRVREVLACWNELVSHGTARLWVLRLLRRLEPDFPEAGVEHDALLSRLDVDQTAEDNLVLTLAAIAEDPVAALGRWSPVGESSAVGSDVTVAAIALLDVALTGSSDAEDAARLLRSVTAAFEKVGTFDSTALETLGPPDPSIGIALQFYVIGLDALLPLDTSSATLDAEARVLFDLVTSPSAGTGALTSLLKDVDGRARSALREKLIAVLPNLDDHSVEATGAALITIDQLSEGSERAALPLAFVRRLIQRPGWPALLSLWLATGPRFDHVARVATGAELLAIPASVWRNYARKSGITSSSYAWIELLRLGARRDQLGAVAEAGVENRIYDFATNAIADGETDSERNVAVERFLDLPQNVRASASTAASVLTRLSRSPAGARSGDFRYVADIALANATRFTPTERLDVRKALGLYSPPLLGNFNRFAQLKLHDLR